MQSEKKQRHKKMDALGAGLLIAMSLQLGLNQSLVKIVNDGIAPVAQSGFRSLFAFPLVLGFALIAKRRLSISDGTLGWGLVNGVLFATEFCLLFLALDYTSVARVSLYFYLMPIWVAIGAHFLMPDEPLNRFKVAGLGVAIAGVALAFSSDLGDAGETAWLGDLLALAGGLFWAAIALVTRTTPLANSSAEMNLLYQLAVSAVILLLVAPLFGPMIREVTPTILWIFAAQVVFVVAIGFVVWFWILSIYPISNMASFSLLTPVFGVFFGWLIFDDPLTPTFLIAIACVSLGVLLVNKQ